MEPGDKPPQKIDVTGCYERAVQLWKEAMGRVEPVPLPDPRRWPSVRLEAPIVIPVRDVPAELTGVPGDITITEQMARAVNQYAGREIVAPEMVGRSFFVGNPGDGGIGINVWENVDSYNVSGGLHFRRFIHADGRIGKMCFGTGGRELYLFGSDQNTCDGVEYEIDKIDPARAGVIIGALYGFGEVGAKRPEDVSNADWIAARGLRLAMGLEPISLLPSEK